MKIIYLNAWNGKIRDGVSEFIKNQSDTDIFCFQEVYDGMKTLCQEILPAYREVTGHKDEKGQKVGFSSTTYVREGLDIVNSKAVVDDHPDTGLGIYTEIKSGETAVHICNFHGVSQPGKLDNPDRIKQSDGLIDFFKEKNGLKIIGGDFNLLPETESVMMFKKNGYRNLIEEFAITTTRNRLSWDKYPEKMYYSDYVFVSQDIKIKSFTVPALEISDHLPLILEIVI